jgi:hypothetical protein
VSSAEREAKENRFTGAKRDKWSSPQVRVDDEGDSDSNGNHRKPMVRSVEGAAAVEGAAITQLQRTDRQVDAEKDAGAPVSFYLTLGSLVLPRYR